MAKGATDEYWERQALPSVFKHTLLDKYVPQFAGMTGSRTAGGRVVFLDGYAGRGRYEDGSPASAERILQIAQSQARTASVSWTCFFVERDKSSAHALAQVVSEYADHEVTATAYRGDVADRLPEVLAAATGLPLFLFLDPCGLGLPYDVLVDLVGRQRADEWPPTEVLINFSLEAVRRISGHIASAHRDERSVRRLDAAVGGTWWHAEFEGGVTDAGVERLVETFATKLSADARMKIAVIPVRRAPTHKPVYHLMFGTRSDYGLWVLGDAVARATQTWWDTQEEVEAEHEPDALFTAASTVRPVLETVEKKAVPVIAENLARLLDEHPSFLVVNHTPQVFGDYYGEVRDKVVRDAVKLLHSQGRTPSTGVGVKRPRSIVVTRP